jgi:flavin reductase (DIM6/NTAB) family NADH-FMN oxidoreductase RutF
MTIFPGEASLADVQRILVGAVVPRPIAFVSTISAGGILNLSPFSFFNAVCSDPPVICFAVARLPAGDPRSKKDTLANIEAIGEFVVNVVSEDIGEQMNLTSGHYPAEVDEFSLSGLTPVKSELVKPPRVGQSPVSFECKLSHNILVSDRPSGSNLVLGEVVCMHVDDNIVDEKNRIDPARLRAIGRMGGISYVRTSGLFEFVRPK